MGGNYNQLEEFNESTGFSLTKPYCNLDIVYDGSNRVTSAIYWKDTLKTIPLESFTITYDGSGIPSIDGVEYREMRFDPWRGRMVPDTIDVVITPFAPVVGKSGGILCQGTLNAPANRKPKYQFVSNVPNQSLYFPPVAETIHVVSTSSEDSASLTGIRSVTILGLSAAGVSQSETLGLTGTTPTTSSLTYLRINNIEAATVGSNDGARGTITFINSTSLVLIDQINIHKNRNESCKITVPTGETYQITGVQFAADRLSEYEVELRYWVGGYPTVPGYTMLHVPNVAASDPYQLAFSLQLTGITDIAVLVRKVSGRNGRSSMSAIVYGALSVQV
jgi:hypothetical protein